MKSTPTFSQFCYFWIIERQYISLQYIQLDTTYSTNNPENNTKTKRTNSTNKCREETTSKRVQREKCSGELTPTSLGTGGRELQVQKGVRNRLSHWEAYIGKMNPHSIWLWITGAEFPEFLPPAEIKAWNIKNQWLGSGRPQRVIGSWNPAHKGIAQQGAIWKKYLGHTEGRVS